MNIDFVSAPVLTDPEGVIAVVVFEGDAGPAQGLDEVTGGAVTRALAGGRFKGGKGQSLDLVAPAGLKAHKIVLIGGGSKESFDLHGAENAAASAYNAAKMSGEQTLTILLPSGTADEAAQGAFGVRLAAYRFDRYRTTEAADKKPTLKTVHIVTADKKAAKAAFKPLSALADGVLFARDLVTEPANILHPEEFAKRVKALESLGLEVEILGEKDMKKLGMGSLLGVGQGSRKESQLAVIQWKGAKSDKTQPVAFVGKGVTFDTGGISIKPAGNMEHMKTDMGGAAAVTGLMMALAGRKAKVNAVGILGLVENMPDGNAQRPGDVVTTMSGQTIEVINTDAEGRLVLADALWYCQDRFKPQFMIDLATLTGAVIVALGEEVAGLFSNNDELSERLKAASEKTAYDQLWRMPLVKAYEKLFDSAVADIRNVGPGPAGGSITAALILQKFVNDVPWAHLDIAGASWRKPSAVPTIPDGATGYGVRLLDQLVADHYED
jgi:leucyl aminopeptidase